jgi:hypothetical protein
VDNEDTQRNSASAARGAPSVGPRDAFDRAMAQHQLATDALGAAIREGDPKAADVAAGEGFAYWLAARAVLRRLESAERVEIPTVESMRYVLRTNRRALVALFGRAEQKLAAPELHRSLAQLRSSLALADDEPAPARDGRFPRKR